MSHNLFINLVNRTPSTENESLTYCHVRSEELCSEVVRQDMRTDELIFPVFCKPVRPVKALSQSVSSQGTHRTILLRTASSLHLN